VLIAFNIVMVILFVYVQQDIASRVSYWYSPYECHPYDGLSCWQPSISRTFLFYVISADCTRAVKCGTEHIPGTLTLDWSQVAILIAAIVDVVQAVRYLRVKTGMGEVA